MVANCFSKPGMIVTFYTDVRGARFCRIEDGVLNIHSSVGLCMRQIVEIDGKNFQNLGHKFVQHGGQEEISYVDLNGRNVVIEPEESVTDFTLRRLEATSFSNFS